MTAFHRKPTILVVDDQQSARMITDALLSREGYDLHFAEDAFTMQTMLPAVQPDLILLDVMMPGMTGFEACKLIKSDEAFRHIPVVLLTALSDMDYMVQGMEVGADDFLTKPVNGGELRVRVRSLLRIKFQYDALQQMMQTREDLAHMTVHDLRSPVTSIHLYAGLLKRSADKPDKVARYADVIQDQSKRLQGLVNQVLVMAKHEHGSLAIQPKVLQLLPFLTKTVEAHQVSADLRTVSIQLECPNNLPNLALDITLVRRVLDNLLTNALKHSPEGGTIYMQIQPAQNAIQFAIGDQGQGVPHALREQIFDKYEATRVKQHGNLAIGLGLAFCKMVIDAHGGNIWVEDNSPSGAKFLFTVPLT